MKTRRKETLLKVHITIREDKNGRNGSLRNARKFMSSFGFSVRIEDTLGIQRRCVGTWGAPHAVLDISLTAGPMDNQAPAVNFVHPVNKHAHPSWRVEAVLGQPKHAAATPRPTRDADLGTPDFVLLAVEGKTVVPQCSDVMRPPGLAGLGQALLL